MDIETVLALDVSSKTGYSVAYSSKDKLTLIDYGTLPKISEPEGKYPSNYVIWAYLNFEAILGLIKKFKPHVLVIEETSKGSKNGLSQKILEFSHFLLAQYIKDNDVRSVYIQTEEWRRDIGCKMNDAEKARNKEVRTYKKKYEKEYGKKTTVAYDINGKRIGIVGRKHVNIRRVSEIFGDQLKEDLRRKDEDLADGLGLLASYHMRRFKENKAIEVTMEEILKD